MSPKYFLRLEIFSFYFGSIFWYNYLLVIFFLTNLKNRIKELHFNENELRKPNEKHINIFSPESNIDIKQLTNFNKQLVNKEIFEFMTLLMDECTHLINYDKPFDSSLVRVISAKDDAYILRDGVNDFNSIWPGSTVEYIDEGHVSAFIRGQPKFRFL